MNPYNIPISLYDNDYFEYQTHNTTNSIYHEHRNNLIFKERWINNITCINLFIKKRST
jgi:hypothetical protein